MKKNSILKRITMLHPAIFAVLFITLILTIELTDSSSNEVSLLGLTLDISVGFLIFGWPIIVTKYINKLNSDIAKYSASLLPYGLAYMVLALFIYLPSVGFFDIPPEIFEKMRNNPGVSYNSEKPLFDLLVFGLAVFIPHYIFWSAASALVSIEKDKKIFFSIRIILTYFQFFFLIFCFYFLHKRLKAISSINKKINS